MIERRSFTEAPDAVMKARRFVVGVLAGIDRALSDDVALMVSELATNSLRHAGSSFIVTVDHDDARLTVSVVDAGPGEPRIQSPLPADPTGRGLRIVSALSDDWGVLGGGSGGGKAVWFRVDLQGGARVSEPEQHRAGVVGDEGVADGPGNETPRARRSFRLAA